MAPNLGAQECGCRFCSGMQWHMLAVCILHAEGDRRVWPSKVFKSHILVSDVQIFGDHLGLLLSSILSDGSGNLFPDFLKLFIVCSTLELVSFFLHVYFRSGGVLEEFSIWSVLRHGGFGRFSNPSCYTTILYFLRLCVG